MKIDMPQWLKSLQNNKYLTDLDITIFSREEIEESTGDVEDARNGGENGTCGEFILVGAIPLVKRDLSMGSVNLWLSKRDSNRIYASFSSKDKWMYLPLLPTPETLVDFWERYVQPGQGLTCQDIGISILGYIHTIREESKKGPARMADPHFKRARFFIGLGEWDDIVELENAMVFNDYLSMEMLTQASAEGVNGNYSQTQSLYSASLFTLERVEAFGTTLFIVDLEYLPAREQTFVQNLKETTLANSPYVNLPSDIPLDLLGACHSFQFTTFATPTSLLREIPESGTLTVEQFNNLLILAVLLPNDEFDSTFRPLAQHPDQKVRDFVAREFSLRGSK